MKGILIGAQHKSGVFEDSKGQTLSYDNLELTLAKEIEFISQSDRQVNGVGQCTTIAKCAYENISKVFGGKIGSVEELENYLGSEVNCFFDDKKKLDMVML